MTLDDIQKNYISEPDGAWRESLTEEEKRMVTEMDNSRIGKLTRLLQMVLESEVNQHGKS